MNEFKCSTSHLHILLLSHQWDISGSGAIGVSHAKMCDIIAAERYDIENPTPSFRRSTPGLTRSPW